MNYTNFSFYLVSYKDKNICYLRTTTTSYRVVEQNPFRIQRTDDLIVKSVLENVLNKCVQTVESSSKPSGRRGKDRREKHSFIKNSNVIDDFEAGMDQDVIAEHYSINSMLF